MIGYSDSGKDAGRLAAAWGLYTVQARPSSPLCEAPRNTAWPRRTRCEAPRTPSSAGLRLSPSLILMS